MHSLFTERDDTLYATLQLAVLVITNIPIVSPSSRRNIISSAGFK